MKILYFDCSGGISGDMLLKAAADLSGCSDEIYRKIDDMKSENMHCSSHNSSSGHDDSCSSNPDNSHGYHAHGRSYDAVKKIIAESSFSEAAKAAAACIYECIAKAEAKVHGADLETVHFHEVGRDEAVMNALAVGMAVELISPDKILTSPIYDGKGTILCSHGEISVPVPAVMALRESCSYDFRTADVNTEMVTPSGLAGLMGIGTEPSEPEKNIFSGARILKETEAKGKRDTGLPGLRAYILEKQEGSDDGTAEAGEKSGA